MKNHDNVTHDLRTLYEAKNADYGSSFDKLFDEFGIITYIIRAQDKLNRLKQLSKPDYEEKITTETIKDTITDLANYSIMVLMRM